MLHVKDPEAPWFLAVTSVTALSSFRSTCGQRRLSDEATALRHSLFNVVSIATTTGYASVDYA